MSEVPSVEEYVEAFERLADDLPESYRKILEVHYAMLDRDITATQLAEADGYHNYKAANLHYGKLGKRVCRTFDLDEKAASGILIEFEHRDGEWHWIMRPQVAEALEQLGWVEGGSGNG